MEKVSVKSIDPSNRVRVIVWEPIEREQKSINYEELVPILRDLGYRMSQLEEERLREENPPEAEYRIDVLRDPPCVVCGAWSDDWLCPSCRKKFPWMHPLRR